MSNSLTWEAVAAAIKATEYKYFGDYEMSDNQREAVDVLVEVARKFYTPPASATTTTGADLLEQAARVADKAAKALADEMPMGSRSERTARNIAAAIRALSARNLTEGGEA